MWLVLCGCGRCSVDVAGALWMWLVLCGCGRCFVDVAGALWMWQVLCGCGWCSVDGWMWTWDKEATDTTLSWQLKNDTMVQALVPWHRFFLAPILLTVTSKLVYHVGPASADRSEGYNYIQYA